MKREEIYEALDRAYFSAEPHEKDLIDRLPRIMQSARVFVDVGASLGQYAFHANRHIHHGLIIAVEADPLRFDRLRTNCAGWASLSNNEIRTVHAAASDVDGRVQFHVTNSEASGGLFRHDTSSLPAAARERIRWQAVDVDCVRLDTLLGDIKPDFIKIDVEGSELRVLKGCARILRDGHARFLIEVHGWADPEGQRNAGDVLAFMKGHCYWPTEICGRHLFVKRGRLAIFVLTGAAAVRVTASRFRRALPCRCLSTWLQTPFARPASTAMPGWAL